MNNTNENINSNQNEELYEKIHDTKLSERSKQLIGQMRGKLEQCERRAVGRINELDIALGQDGIKDRAVDELRLWQEKYKLRQELKDDNFRNKILERLKNWSV